MQSIWEIKQVRKKKKKEKRNQFIKYIFKITKNKMCFSEFDIRIFKCFVP